jgi:hypothetical protein
MWDIISAALGGGILGTIARLIPEVLKLWTQASDQAHEIAMRKLDHEMAMAGSEQKIREQDAAGNIAFDSKALDALMAGINAQAKPTGVKWVDALSASVRPVLTYWWMTLYSVFKLSIITVLVVTAWDAKAPDVLENVVNVGRALVAGWSPDDVIILSGIINFWFLDRVIAKRLK